MLSFTRLLAFAAAVTALPANNLPASSLLPVANNLTIRRDESDEWAHFEVNTLIQSNWNPPLTDYPTRIKLVVTALREKIGHIRIYVVDTPFGCEFDLNCAVHGPDIDGPRQDIGWSTYYLPCLGNQPLQVHHGEFCRQKAVMGQQFDNLWFRYEDQFFNVPTDCVEDQEWVRDRQQDCAGPDPQVTSLDYWWVWAAMGFPDADHPYRQTCTFGSLLNVTEIRETMENPGEPKGETFGHPYCDEGHETNIKTEPVPNE